MILSQVKLHLIPEGTGVPRPKKKGKYKMFKVKYNLKELQPDKLLTLYVHKKRHKKDFPMIRGNGRRAGEIMGFAYGVVDQFRNPPEKLMVYDNECHLIWTYEKQR